MDTRTSNAFWRGIAQLPPLLLLSLLQALPAGAQGPIRGLVDSMGYGYAVKISVNGTPIKIITGGGQQATRLFAVDHPMKAQASPDQKDLFILREGENSIAVEFRKLDDGQLPLQVKLEIPDRYAVPVFHLKSVTAKTGTFERTFRIEKKMPDGFKTIEITDVR